MNKDLLAMQHLQNGDDRYLVDLMERHKDSVFRYALRYMNNESDAAEITGETFYRVFKNASKFKPKAQVKTWIFSICINLCKDSLRKQKKYKNHQSLYEGKGEDASSVLLNNIPNNEEDPFEKSSSQERMDAIEEAIQALPHKIRVPFIFCILEDHSYSDCALSLNISIKTVETRIYRARQKLREQLVDINIK